MCRTLRSSGISAFSLLACLVAVFASGTCSAQSFFWQAQPVGGGSVPVDGYVATDLASAMASEFEQAEAQTCGSSYPACWDGQVYNLNCPNPGAPTASNQSENCTFYGHEINYTGPGCPTGCTGNSVQLLSFSCASFATNCAGATNCAAQKGQSAYANGLTSTSGVTKNSGGCMERVNPPGSGVCVQVPGFATGWTCATSNTGQYVAASGVGAGQGTNCVSAGGTTACVQSTGSGQGSCGTFNGDQVCPSSLPNSSCVFFASGGSMCSVNAGTLASGAPTNASGGAVGATGQVIDGPPNSGGATANYYSSTVTTSSSTTVVGASGGANVGNGGVGSGSGGTGTQPGSCGSDPSTPCSVVDANAAANGDCSSGDCSATGNPMPTYDWSSDSWGGALTSFWNAVSAGPVGSAVGGIASNWPSSDECPAETVVISTVNLTADYGSDICSVWENSALPVLSAVMLAVWSITAVFIFLSA